MGQSIDTEEVRRSYLQFVAEALGPKYLVLLTLSVIISTWLVWRLSHRQATTRLPSLTGLTVLLPFGVGLMGLLDALTSTWGKICMAKEPLGTLRIGDVAIGFMFASISASVGLMLTAIPYSVAVFCAFRAEPRSGTAERSNAADSR